MTREELDRAEKLAGEATPGPWRVAFHDDSFHMNAISIRTDDLNEDLGGSGEEPIYGGCVAMTLLQQPRYICHRGETWDEDAAFIAAARTLVPELVAEVRSVKARLALALLSLRRVCAIRSCAPHFKDWAEVEEWAK